MTTEPPSSFTDTSAVITAKINPNGSATTYWFQYGIDRDMRAGTNMESAGSGTTDVFVNAAITGLQPATTYYFRVRATNTHGPTIGDILSFTTQATPDRRPQAITLPPSSILETSTTVTGRVNPTGSATSYWFQYGVDRSLSNRTSASSAGSGSLFVDVSKTLSGLVPETLYYYRLVAENSFGRAEGDILTLLTKRSGGAPTIITRAASGVTHNAAMLNGSVDPNGQGTNAWFEYRAASDGAWTSVGLRSVGSGTSLMNYSFSLSGLQSNSIYVFRAVAQNTHGTTFGDVLNFTTGTQPGLPPAVTTNAATSVTESGAILNGNANPNGVATAAWFEWGTTQSLGNSTSHQSMGSGTGSANVSSALAGLASNTTYFFRAVAENIHGRTHGAILSFTTSGNSGSLPTVFTEAATSVTKNSAVLRGTADPNGSPTNTWFEWGTTQSLGSAVGHQFLGSGTQSADVSYNLTGLQPNTTYFFRAVAENAHGRVHGSILSFTTPSEPGSAPSLLTNPATDVRENSATLRGAVNPNGHAADAWFEYSVNQTSWTEIGIRSVGSGTSFINYSFSLTGLQPNTTYFFRAAGRNTHGTSFGSILSFSTQGGGGAVPSVTTNPATDILQTRADLHGAVNPNGAAASAWFEYGTTQSLGTIVGTRSMGSGTQFINFAFELNNLSPNTTYFFRAVAENVFGRNTGQILSFTTDASGGGSGQTAPVAITESATSVTKNSGKLNATIDPNGALTTAWFEIGTSESLGEVAGRNTVGSGSSPTSFSSTKTGLLPDTTYFFRAVAESSLGVDHGDILSFTTERDTTAPAPPIVFTNSAKSIKKTSATLAATINPNRSATNAWFEIGTSPDVLQTVGHSFIGSGSTPKAFTFAITNLTPDTTYFFRAAAENAEGISRGEVFTFVTEVETVSGGGPPSAFTNSATSVKRVSATLKGTVNPNARFTNAWFEIGTDSSPDRIVGHQVAGSGSSHKAFSFAVSDLDPDTTYFYQVAAENSEGITHGEIFSFTTLESLDTGGDDDDDNGGDTGTGSAPDVVTNSASSVGQSFATLNGHVDPNRRSTTAWFEWGSTLSLGNTTNRDSVGSGSESQSFSISISGLQSNTNYYYRAVAENSRGTDFGSIVGFTTGSGGGGGSASGLPIVYTNQPTTFSGGSTELSGTVNPNGGFTNAWFEYGTNQSSLSAVGHRSVGSGFTNTTFSFTLSSLDSGITYYYRAVAQNSNGISYGSLIAFVPNQGSGSAPFVTTSPSSFVSTYSALLNGTVNPNGSQTSAWFEWGTTQSLGRQTTPQLMGSVNTSLTLAFALVNLNPSTTYYYRAVAQNSGGTRQGSILSFTTQSLTPSFTPPPPPPQVIVRTVEVIKTSKGKVLVELTPSVDLTRPRAGDEMNYSLLYNNKGEVDVTDAVLTITLPEEVELRAINREPDAQTARELIFRINEIKVGGQGLISLKVKIDESLSRDVAISFMNRIEYLDDVKASHVFTSILTLMVEGRRSGFLSFLAGIFDLPGWLSNLFLILLLLLVFGYVIYGVMRDRELREAKTGRITPLADRFRQAQSGAGE